MDWGTTIRGWARSLGEHLGYSLGVTAAMAIVLLAFGVRMPLNEFANGLVVNFSFVFCIGGLEWLMLARVPERI